MKRQEIIDLIAGALDDSLGPDWNSHIGATAALEALTDEDVIRGEDIEDDEDETLDSVVAEFENHPCFATAQALRRVAKQYHDDEMIEDGTFAAYEAKALPFVDSEACPGHVASEADPKVCGRCGTHIDEYRDEEPVE